MENTEKAQAINSLTSDEDERHDLWVRCLESGNDDVNALSVYLADIRKQHSEEQLLQVTVWRQVYNSGQLALLTLFDQFTDIEQTVMRLLAIGATLEQIEGITHIGRVRLLHIVSVIREHEVWNKLNGT